MKCEETETQSAGAGAEKETADTQTIVGKAEDGMASLLADLPMSTSSGKAGEGRMHLATDLRKHRTWTSTCLV